VAQASLTLLRDADDLKGRGAYFTPPAIAEFLTGWAIADRPDARILDPTCGDGVFLDAAARELRRLGCLDGSLDEHVYGVDVHAPTLRQCTARLESQGLDAHLVASDFFELDPPNALIPSLPQVDAIVGNPPFIRYHEHRGSARHVAREAALRQGVTLSGLASSWPSVLIHASSFLKPDGRLAMVLPAELLTVAYAQPVRKWLRTRFASITLVLFEKLQFEDALENVVLLLASGSGGCETISVHVAHDACDLLTTTDLDTAELRPTSDAKWTEIFLSANQAEAYRNVTSSFFQPLRAIADVSLGTVTGANHFFAMSEKRRQEYQLRPGHDVVPIVPPGVRGLRGTILTQLDWEKLKADDANVWLLYPGEGSPKLEAYLRFGEQMGVPDAYKCRIRTPWWRPPLIKPPDAFFTYMSHSYPRIIANPCSVACLNSLHGVNFHSVSGCLAEALPLLSLNSLTMLGAELSGRSYGGGVLKMEPTEAGLLPVPKVEPACVAWRELCGSRGILEEELREGRWESVVTTVDHVLLRNVLRINEQDIADLKSAALSLRRLRLRRASKHDE